MHPSAVEYHRTVDRHRAETTEPTERLRAEFANCIEEGKIHHVRERLVLTCLEGRWLPRSHGHIRIDLA